MSFNYTQADLETRVNAKIQGKKGILTSVQDTLNEGVRELVSKVDLKSLRREQTLTPNLFNGIFKYTNPSDLKGQSIIDIPAQAKRYDGEFCLVPSETFERNQKPGFIAIDHYNGASVLRIASEVDSKTLLISELDSLTSGGGTWSAFGDAESLERDDADFVKGAGSVSWAISSAGGTTAGLVNDDVNEFDISDYLDGTSAFFVWAKINSTTNLTNYILRFGTDSSNYYSKTVTSQFDGTAFATGWNLLKFDVSSLSTTGTPTNTSMNYIALYMTKDAAKVSESDYKFDWLVLKKGVVHNVKYYSKYGWQTSGGTWQANSSDASDILVADEDEFNLYVKSCVIVAMDEIGYPEQVIDKKQRNLEKDIQEYLMKNPSEAKIMMYDYAEFTDGDTDNFR